MAPAAPAPNARESKVVISPSFEKVPGSQHPWSNVEDRTFWSGRRPQRHWRKVFRRRSRPSLPPDVQIGRVSQRAVPPSSSPKGTSLSMPKKRRIQGDDGGISPCWELPGDTADSPKELATFEQGTYEEVQKELTATAREMAIQLRRKQTLQQLEQLQLDEPGIIRIRRFPSREIAELDSELPEPTELPGWEMRASSSDPASCVYELDMSDDIHEPKETTSRIAQPRDSQTEPPFSDLEAVGDPDSRGHLEEMPMIPPGSNISYSAQDIGPQDESRLRIKTEAATRNYYGHLTEPNSSNHWGNNEIRSNCTANRTNCVPIDAGLEPQRHSSSQVHSRNPSGSVTLLPFDGENESHSLFTDLDTLIKALPARTSCRQK